MIEKKVPVRTCICCRNEFEKKQLLRIVKTKDGVFSIDRTGKANGRGAYICSRIECAKKLNKAKVLDRVFSMAVPQEIYSQIEEELLAKK